jgi:hypothetical protein
VGKFCKADDAAAKLSLTVGLLIKGRDSVIVLGLGISKGVPALLRVQGAFQLAGCPCDIVDGTDFSTKGGRGDNKSRQGDSQAQSVCLPVLHH